MNFRFTHEGNVTEVSYQTMIRRLDIENEIVHGRPLTAGGAPQALTVKGLIEKAWPDVEVGVWFQGSQIF